MIHAPVRALLDSVVDYAGLFPPSGLDLHAAAERFLSHRQSEHAWALGRFVVPAGRLPELPAALAAMPGVLSVLAEPNTLDDVQAANLAGIQAIEIKAPTPAQIRGIAPLLPSDAHCYFEIPLNQDPRKALEAIAESGARAKVRTGGLTHDAFPGSRDLGRFIVASVDQGLAFKATAGLHHPLRGEYSVSDAPQAETVLMHGFLNVLLAASFARAGMELGEVVRLLEDSSPSSFAFDPEGVSWRGERVDTDQIVDARKNLVISFGSCLFEQPIAELHKLGLL